MSTRAVQELDRVTRQFEALKYSGEARNTGNQRMLAEFEAHLHDQQQRASDARDRTGRTTKLLVRVKTGIDHLHDKLDRLKPVQFRAASTARDRLTETQLRLGNLVDELSQRKGELADADPAPPLILPTHNARVFLTKGVEKENADEEDSNDDDVVSREQMKRQAQSVVDSKTKKPRKKKKSRY